MVEQAVLFLSIIIVNACHCNAFSTMKVNMTGLVVDTDFQRFTGYFRFPTDEDLYVWTGTITFSEAIGAETITGGSVRKLSATRFSISNLRDTVTHKGGVLEIKIEASYGEVSPPTATATITNSFKHDNITIPDFPNKDGTKYNYNEVIYKSIMFYEAQRSGKLPSSNRISFRGDSAMRDIGDRGEDLTGGWYDGGDNEKFGFPMASATTMLLWGLLKYKDGYVSANQLDQMYDCVRWPLEWMIKCHVSPNELYVQNKNGDRDHGHWDPPETIRQVRHFYKVDIRNPGSDVASEYSAAMTAGYLVFKDKDPVFAAKLLSHSKQLFKFAVTYKGKYSTSLGGEVQKFYASTHHEDELTWAAAWLYKATNDQSYLTYAEKYYVGSGFSMSWDDKSIGSEMLLYELTKDSYYKREVTRSLGRWIPPDATVTYTRKGLAFQDDWGSLRYSANMAFMALIGADNGLLNATKLRCWAKSQINYILGDSGRSYMVGFGNNPPMHAHHRAASCPGQPLPCGFNYFHTQNPNPHILYGAVVGGPDKNDAYSDSRPDYKHNEPACDYNAGFQSTVAGFKSLLVRELFPKAC